MTAEGSAVRLSGLDETVATERVAGHGRALELA